jgi:hypothetical protein
MPNEGHYRTVPREIFRGVPRSGKVLIVWRPSGPDADRLGVVRDSLGHLHNRPHVDALRWTWEQWKVCIRDGALILAGSEVQSAGFVGDPREPPRPGRARSLTRILDGPPRTERARPRAM